jgi:hypothetical protein
LRRGKLLHGNPGSYRLTIDRPPLCLIATLAAQVRHGMEQRERQRRALLHAREVIVHTASGAIGDCIGELRYAFLAARSLADKHFTIIVHPALATLTWLDAPSNATLTTEPPDHFVRHPDAFWMTWHFAFDLQQAWREWKQRFNLAWDLRPIMYAMNELQGNGRAASAAHLLAWCAAGPKLSFAQEIRAQRPEPRPRYNAWDTLCLLQSWLLGIPLDADDVQRSLITRDLWNVSSRDSTLDVLVAPDAWGSFMVGVGRSFKSLSAAKWGEVLEALPADLSVGIVIGTAHPEYCETVYYHARSVHADTRRVVTPTLADFCVAVAGAAKFVGSDSGTTHLAAEVAQAQPEEGTLALRVLFNSEVANPALHGIRGLGNRGQVLVYYAPERRYQRGARELFDISQLGTTEVTQFVMS